MNLVPDGSSQPKATTEELEQSFDATVDCYTNLETGQQSTMDAPLAMALITRAAVASTPRIRRMLEIGCGAGNNTLKLLQAAPGAAFNCDLLDLSQPMLEQAKARIEPVCKGQVRTLYGDFRSVELPRAGYDVILAATVLHHLRDDRDWESTFAKIYDLTAPGGSVWITDLVSHETAAVQAIQWDRYGDYLRSVGGEEYRDGILDSIARNDTPRSVTFQLDLLRKVGFGTVELLHKNCCYAAFGAIKD